VLSFLDAGVPPLSAVIATQLARANTKVFSDGKIAARVCMWVNKFHGETTMTASFPDNPIAHDSVAGHLEAMRSVCIRVAEGRAEMEHARKRHSASPAPIVISRT
jgi:mycolipenoyl-CoA---2-(long-chain-fatty acyl)-trehalose mycolipenoyltransferase / long-chain-acyl-CoA---trehalose acyltransferase